MAVAAQARCLLALSLVGVLAITVEHFLLHNALQHTLVQVSISDAEMGVESSKLIADVRLPVVY